MFTDKLLLLFFANVALLLASGYGSATASSINRAIKQHRAKKGCDQAKSSHASAYPAEVSISELGGSQPAVMTPRWMKRGGRSDWHMVRLG